MHTEDGDVWGSYTSQKELKDLESRLNSKGAHEKKLLAALERAREHIDEEVKPVVETRKPEEHATVPAAVYHAERHLRWQAVVPDLLLMAGLPCSV